MKKLLKHVKHVPEKERTKKQKRIRDLVFFGVVAFAAIMAYATVSVEAGVVEAESALIMSSSVR
jgi:hypothetical protein